MKARLDHVLADGAAVGAGVLCLLNLLDWAAHRGLGSVALPEAARLALLSSIPEVVFRGGKAVFSRWGAVGLWIVVAAAVFRRTRPLAEGFAVAAAAVSGAWVAAVACALSYALYPAVGVALAALAFLPAALLTRSRRWPVVSMVVLAAGLALGALGAQFVIVLQPAVGRVINPLYGFLPFALLSPPAFWLASKYVTVEPMALPLRIGRFWGLSAASLAATFAVACEVSALQPRAPAPGVTRVLDDWAYDLSLKGEPPALLWTNQKHFQVLDDAYGGTPERRALDEGTTMVERIWPSRDGGFYLQSNKNVGYWSHTPDGQPIPFRPTAWMREPASIIDGGTTAAALVEDPLTRRFLLISEWRSHYAVMDRDTNTEQASGTLSDAMWSWPYATTDAPARTAFISSPIDDGGLYEFDLDAMRVKRRAPSIYLYETVLDPETHLLWGARPLTGELLGVDTRTLQIRERIPVEALVRDVQRDAATGDLFTCSYLFGNVYRVSGQTQVASKIGWCGRICRNLFLDAPRSTLWVATGDGICRIPLDDRIEPAKRSR